MPSRTSALIASTSALLILGASLALADGAAARKDAASPPGVIFSNALTDVPGKHLVVVSLQWDPKSDKPFMAHHHPGSVYVYVTKGAVKLGVEGEPVRIVHAGESFFEAPGAHHVVGESASPTEPASAIAVLIVPDGAPLVTADEPKK
jgi:quercetin dioxygenase-like cupin family protein